MIYTLCNSASIIKLNMGKLLVIYFIIKTRLNDHPLLQGRLLTLLQAQFARERAASLKKQALFAN
jgi:hypothetical protein